MKAVFLALFFLSCLFGLPAQSTGQQQPVRADSSQSGLTVPNDSLPTLPKGAIIHKVTEDKVYCFLPANTLIQGILCRGDKHRGWETVFYRNGKLALVWPARDTEIQGVPCRAASFWTEVSGGSARVTFYPNGRLKSCKLAKDCTIQGHRLKKGEHVEFNSKGKLLPGK